MAMRKLVMTTVLGASVLAALPAAALADGGHGRHHGHRHHHEHRGYHEYYAPERPTYYRERYVAPRAYYREPARRRCGASGTTGMIVGGTAGALLGRELDRRGDRAPGTILGAGAGALLGRELTRDRC